MISNLCPICGGSRRGPALEKGQWRFEVCSDCQHGWLQDTPPPAEELYGEAYFRGEVPGGYDDYVRDEPFHRAIARARISALAKAGLRAPARVAEVGCAYGFGLAEFAKAGFEVTAAEVSRPAREHAEHHLGQSLHASMTSLTNAEAASSHAVLMFQVLEHLPDPRAALKQCAQMLAPAGLLAIETWDRGSFLARLFGRSWQQLSPPAVVHLFSRRSLSLLLGQVGFGSVSIAQFSKPIGVRFALEQATRAFPVVRSWTSKVARRVPATWGVPYIGDDLILCTARKASD